MRRGHVRDRFARLMLALPSRDGVANVEFVVDTGFDGELALPSGLLTTLDAAYAGDRPLLLADGSVRRHPFYQVIMEWDEEERIIEVIALDGNPLLGVELLEGNLFQSEMTDGGEVTVEPL